MAVAEIVTQDEHLLRHWAKKILFDNTTPGAIGLISADVQSVIEELNLDMMSLIIDEPFGISWDGDVIHGASRNSLFDIINSLGSITRKYNQIPIEVPNGIRSLFTIPSGDKYKSGSLVVYLNGVVETTALEISDTQFQMDVPLPTSRSKITADYTIK